MNDRYLFRAWDANEKKMDYDVVLCETGVAVVEYGELCGTYEEGWMILMQCTGLKDRHGKLIFEGDIVSIGDRRILYKIEWHDTGFMGKALRAGDRIGLSYWIDKIEVIGNVYDNPELMEV